MKEQPLGKFCQGYTRHPEGICIVVAKHNVNRAGKQIPQHRDHKRGTEIATTNQGLAGLHFAGLEDSLELPDMIMDV